MIKKNKWQLIVSSLIILLPIVAGLLIWNDLPEQIATHWGANGEPDGWSSRSFAVLGMPLILLAVHWLCVFVTSRDPKNEDQSGKVFNMVFWILPVISLIACGITYAVAMGNEINTRMITYAIFAIIFIILGNYMPKCKQNYTIGIKIPWTLHDEENWNKTHRFAGRLWVIGGFLFLIALFIPMESLIPMEYSMYASLAFILLIALAPTIYSYIYYRNHLKD